MNKKYRTIIWQDHTSDSSWKSEKELKEWVAKIKPCISKGWVTFENREWIILSASFDGEENWGENICILKRNIVK